MLKTKFMFWYICIISNSISVNFDIFFMPFVNITYFSLSFLIIYNKIADINIWSHIYYMVHRQDWSWRKYFEKGMCAAHYFFSLLIGQYRMQQTVCAGNNHGRCSIIILYECRRAAKWHWFCSYGKCPWPGGNSRRRYDKNPRILCNTLPWTEYRLFGIAAYGQTYYNHTVNESPGFDFS